MSNPTDSLGNCIKCGRHVDSTAGCDCDAPTSSPGETGGEVNLRERIAAAVCAHIDKEELDEVMNRHAVEGLKNDLTFIITKEVK